jgi:subtilase family protein
MTNLFSSCAGHAARAVLALAVLPFAPAALGGTDIEQVAVATDGRTLFSISADRTRIIVQPLEASERYGTPLRRPFVRLEALAYDEFALTLVVVDGGAGVVLRLRGFDVGDAETVVSGLDPEVLQGARVAASRGEVYVGLPAEHKVVRVTPREVTRREWFRPLPPDLPFEPGSDLAASGSVVVVSVPSQHSTVFWDALRPTAIARVGPGEVASARGATSKVNQLLSGDLAGWSPGPMTVIHGIAYVADTLAGHITAISVQTRQPVQLPGGSVGPVKALVASEEELVVLLGNGRTERRVRYVPVQISFEDPKRIGVAAEVVSRFLAEKGAIVEGPVSARLRSALASKSDVEAAKGEVELEPLFCGLNGPLCQNGKIRPTALGPSATVRFAALTEERYIDPVELKLDGKRSVREALDRLITTPELAAWKIEDRVARLNPGSESAVLSQRDGMIWVPAERVRYIAALRRYDDRALRQAAASQGVSAYSLERVASRTEDAGDGVGSLATAPPSVPAATSPLDPAWIHDLQQRYLTMRSVIKFPLPPPPPPGAKQARSQPGRMIGVAEPIIDREHPDLKGAFSEDEDSAAAPPPPEPAVLGSPTVKANRDREDHGTAVCGLLGARRSAFDGGAGEGLGLLPDATLVPIEPEPPGLIERLRLEWPNLKVVNVSQSFQHDDGFLDFVTLKSREHLLFVAAAGNEGKQIRNEVWHPYGLGRRENVLVVAATTGDGKGILLDSNGNPFSNYGPEYVAIAAPGEGFYGPGRNNTYVPLKGTSFATPLVAAAAMLLADRTRPFTPWFVKERLVYTADFVPALSKYVSGGVLNVDRALANLDSDMLETITRRPDRVNLALGAKITFVTKMNPHDETVNLADLRRLQKVSDKPDPGRWRALVHMDDTQDDSPNRHLKIIDDILPDKKTVLTLSNKKTIPLADVKDFVSAWRAP